MPRESSRCETPWWVHPLTLAAAAVAVEVVAGFAAVGTLTLSTVPENRAATTGRYLVLVGCGVALLFVAALLWRGGLHLAAVLLGIATIPAMLGAVTWFSSLPLALAATVLCVVTTVRRSTAPCSGCSQTAITGAGEPAPARIPSSAPPRWRPGRPGRRHARPWPRRGRPEPRRGPGAPRAPPA